MINKRISLLFEDINIIFLIIHCYAHTRDIDASWVMNSHSHINYVILEIISRLKIDNTDTCFDCESFSKWRSSETNSEGLFRIIAVGESFAKFSKCVGKQLRYFLISTHRSIYLILQFLSGRKIFDTLKTVVTGI